jgi:23S rRNA pseudouridine2605 synthase
MTEFDEGQLAAARAKAWHQDGNAIVTLEAARDWLNERGLVLFAPRTAQLPMPAPTLVEATLGAATVAPTMAQTEIARGLVSRLVGEGLALPLNLLGIPGDSPDFVVSAQVFSYIFTMRGDKAWKLPPSTSGAVKVSPLGLKVYEALTERGPMSASELASELGREVTEAAILRSLSELWGQLRVLPLLQTGEGVTLWELTARRFTKAIKAGANAGQPKALSAVVSLYLAQVFAATEEEITTFLSPLTARSRVREVVHALMGARQLDTLVIEGKTLLHIPGGLPVVAGGEAAVEGESEEPVVVERPKKVGTGRISKFGEGAATKSAGEFRGKPAGRPAARSFIAGAARKPAAKFGAKFGPRADGKSDPERRPFKKSEGAAKPSFSKPWDEAKKPRAAAKADGFTKFRRPEPEDRPALGAREQAGLPVEKRSAPRSATKSFDRGSKPSGFAKRPYAPRGEASEGTGFTPRSYEKPRTFGAKAAGAKPFGAKKPYAPRGEGAEGKPFVKRPYTTRSEGSATTPYAKRPYTQRTEGEGAKPFAKRPYTPRTEEGGAKPYAKRPYTPRAEGEGSTFKARSFAGKSGGAKPYAKRPYTSRAVSEDSGSASSSVERSLPKRPYKPRAADADQRKFTKEPWSPPAEEAAPKRAFKPRSGGGFGGARKSFGAKPGFKRSGPPRKRPGAGE